jgi:oxygen-dependent protoporphyrinogen oxidase
MGDRVAIIGGGLAGLAAGYRLTSAGLSPVVFEAEEFIGGRSSSEEVDGFIIDKAAYTWPEFHRNLTAFLDRIGLAGDLLPTPGTSSTWRGGEEFSVKVGSPRDFLGYRLLSFRDKLTMIRLFLSATARFRDLNLAAPTARSFSLEQETAAAFLERKFGRKILEDIAYPICAEIFLGTPETNSRLAFMATIKNLAWFKIFSLRTGMGAVAERMAAGLEVHLASPVARVTPLSPEGPYQIDVGGKRPATHEFDAVILAVPAPVVPRIFAACAPALTKYFDSVGYAPSMVVALALDRRRPETSFINNLLRRDHRVLATLTFDHHKGPQRCPPDKGLATAVLTAAASQDLMDAPDEKVVAEVLGEVDRSWPGISKDVLFSRVYRWKHGAVQLGPGAIQRRHQAARDLEAGQGNVFFAGDGVLKSSLEIAFNSGVRAAENLPARLGLSLAYGR